MSEPAANLATQFQLARQTYEKFADKLKTLLIEILREHGITSHAIDGRCKEVASLKKKIERKEGKYSSLGEITDLVGLRIITYFSDDVDRIAKIVEGEFDVDEVNTIDKRKSLDFDKFGYMSLHYVVSLKPSRADLSEYRKFAGVKAEIQIRSILQHAWAEIEHDLGYKSTVGLPDPVRRRFARLASLLELADEQFAGLRTSLNEYAADVSREIKSQPESVRINTISLREFTATDATFKEIVNATDASLKSLGIKSVGGVINLGILSQRLSYIGIINISDLRAMLNEHKEGMGRYMSNYLKSIFRENRPRVIVKPSILSHFIYYILGLSGDSGKLIKYMELFSLQPEKGREMFASNIVRWTMHEADSSDVPKDNGS